MPLEEGQEKANSKTLGYFINLTIPSFKGLDLKTGSILEIGSQAEISLGHDPL